MKWLPYLCILWAIASTNAASARTVVIDVRTPAEYAEGHIENALNLEYQTIRQQISRAGVSKDDTLILYCRTGRRSAIALKTLQEQGYTKAENFGGLDEARKRLKSVR